MADKLKNNKLNYKLGDIIKIIAPTDPAIDGRIYLINYYDADKIRLDEPNGDDIVLTLTDGYLDNKSIESIVIKSRASEEGYARQNNLFPGVWIDINFGGDLPLTFTGQITNLVEDKIEITTHPEKDVIFIDFAYKGLPEDLQISNIKIRRAPADVIKTGVPQGVPPGVSPPIDEQGVSPPIDELGEAGIERAEPFGFERAEPFAEPLDQLRTLILNADQIMFGEDLEPVKYMIDVPIEEQRYDIENQLDDLLDNMLSTIPNAERTDLVKNNIHKMIQRFKQLREKFSIFDENGYALMPKVQGAKYKPLINVMEKLDKQLYWMMPVVKIIKKIYSIDAGNEEEQEEISVEDDANLLSFFENYNEETAIIDQYEKNDTAGDQNKYDFLQKRLNPFLTPYLTPFKQSENNDNIILDSTVNANIMAIVDNLGNFKSTVTGTNTITLDARYNKLKRKIDVKRFLTQNYITGTTGLEMIKVRGENPLIKRKNLTSNDTISIKSLITLQEPTVRFSRINLYSTNILDKANLNLHFLNYWQLLKAKTRVSTTNITDINKPYNHDPDTFLTKVKHFKLNEELLNNADEKETYNNFLDTVIPQTKFLFNLIKPYLTGKLSINDILIYLEPFMVYHEDLTFMQYKEMNEYIRDKIYEYQRTFLAKARKYGNIKGTQIVAIPSLIKILDENPNLKTKVLDAYGFTDTITQMTNAEFIKRITEFDTGIFYNNAVALASTNLMIAEGSRNMADINIYLNAGKGAAAATAAAASKKQTAKSKMLAQTVTGDNTCNKIKVIAKRYIELEELNEDNGKESFFDKKYDTTDYSVSKADSNMPVEEQLKYYADRVIKNKGMDEINARREAEALIKGKRTVEDGDYAILETTDENSATIQYYVRQNDAWKLDDSIDSETFADNASLFCNLNEKCIAVKETCQDQQTGANELKKHNLKLLLSEFDSNLNANKDIVLNKIDDEIIKADARIELLKGMRLRKMYQYETAKIALGNTLETVEKIKSPNDGLLQTILGQADTAKRYLDIINFVKYFTRLGIIESGESPFWFYCTKTSKQMLPTFIHKLAITYTTNKANYIHMLDTICAEQGTLSEDGDKWIDKHSGYTIKMTELSADEEYTAEGFKVVSHAVQEADAGDIILASAAAVAEQKLNKTVVATVRKFSTLDATKIYNVIESMSTNIGINIDGQADFIVRNVLNLITNDKVMPPKANYEKFVQMNAAKGKEVDSYENAYNSKLIYLTLAYFLIAIQISIPPIKTKTTYPGCKKSFSGFPIDDETDNKKGITYIACVAHKIKSNPNLPWSAIGKKNAQFIITQMEALITTFILPTEEYKNGVKEFKQYLESNPDVSDIPDEHNVSNWTNFLPPLKPLKMKLPQDVGDVFKTHLKDSLRKGSAAQHDYILELQSKILMFSFSIIELVEKTVHGEGLILKSNSGEPFVENACCESSTAKTLQYFINKTPDIATYNNKVVNLSDMLDDTIRMSKASILYDPNNTKRKLTELSNTFSEETIYRAFIVYCKFNSLLPLSENLKVVCSTKPDNFDASDSISESIRKLKSNSRNYNENSLAKLLDVVNNSTKQTIEPVDIQINNVSKLSEIMEKIDRENTLPSNFRADFIAVLDEFEMNALMEDTKQLRKLKNLLGALNASMQKELFDFIATNNVKVKKDENFKFRDCLDKIVIFKETGDNLFLGAKEETGYKMINFMKKTMRCLTKEYPNIIINGINYEENVKVPGHWKLSQYHVNDVRGIIKTYYAKLKQFYKDDQITLLLKKFTDISLDINELAQNTLFYAPVEIIGRGKQGQAQQAQAQQAQAQQTQEEEKSQSPVQPRESTHKYSAFDLDLNVYLFKFYFLSILTDLMNLKDDEEILQLPISSAEDTSMSAEDLLFASAANSDVLEGNKVELSEKIASLIVTFTNLICDDKQTVDYNYASLMEVILRSRVKEKDEITDYLGKMTVEERAVENLFKNNKLGRWSKGEQKGVHTYDTKTYDQEREDMEKMAQNEARLNKRCAVTDLNRDIYALEMLEEDAANEEADREDNMINYMGEDAEPEDYDMDGDENFY